MSRKKIPLQKIPLPDPEMSIKHWNGTQTNDRLKAEIQTRVIQHSDESDPNKFFYAPPGTTIRAEPKFDHKNLPTNVPLSIAFTYPYGNGFDPAWVESLTSLLLYECSKSKEDRVLGSVFKAGSCYVDSNRNELARQFNNMSYDDWICMVDPDVQFKPNILELAKAHILANPEVCIFAGRVNLLNGLPVFYRRDTKTGRHIFQPFAFRGLQEFDHVGTGIIFIKREVFVKLHELFNSIHFFMRIETEEKIDMGDDFSFCMRVKKAGYKIYGAWDIVGVHWKPQPCFDRYPSLEQLGAEG